MRYLKQLAPAQQHAHQHHGPLRQQGLHALSRDGQLLAQAARDRQLQLLRREVRLVRRETTQVQQERRLLHQLLHRGEVPAAPLRQPLAQRLEAVRAVPRAGVGGNQRLLEHVGELADKVRRGDEFDEGGVSKKLAMVCGDGIQG